LAPAEDAFRRSVELQPGEFWPNFFQGACAYRLGHFQDAATALSICVALAPATAECYYNRAKAYEALGRTGPALADYTRALALNPRFSDAALNRGILAFRAGDDAQALADFERARGLIAYNRALLHVARKHWPAASAGLREAVAAGSEAARALSERLGLE
jgi:tetratricopeptide (TPR) repeat protein